MKIELTEKEKAAQNWLDLSDESLGKLTRALVAKVQEYADEQGKLHATAAALVLICGTHNMNATKTTIDIEGATYGTEQMGDWRVTIKRKK